MKLKLIIIAALIAFAGNVWADTTKLLESDGWTKITSLPSASDIANNYYVFVDNSNDLMLGVGKGVNQNTKWYSLGVYYQNSVEATSADINGKVWTLETQGSNFAMRNLEYSVLVMQTESARAWMFDTNDVPSPNSWAEIALSYSNGSWTIQNAKYGGSNYLGPWTAGNFTNGAECAANKSGNDIGHFQIYAISRTQFKQNLLDNASDSNPVDLTPWYVTNATFDAGNRTGWTEEGSGGNNNTSYGGGCEIWHRSNFKIYQDLTVPNGKYKTSLQIAGTSGAGQVYGTSGSTNKTASSSAAAGSNFQNTVLSMIQDRTFGKVITDKIEVSNGSLQVGMKCETTDQWLVFDNFKLYCTGVDLSAYEAQLADLVTECNNFISSGVVPEACENAISNAITTYNTSYSTGKEYSAAIVALTAVLNTYKNDTELKTAYANFNSFKTKIVGLTNGQSASEALTTFNSAVSTATSAVEAATNASTITEQIPNLRSAGLTYISSVEGQFDITFLASQNYWDWKKKDGNNAGIVQDQFLINRPNNIPSFAESYETSCATTGNVLYQTVSDLPVGYYQVGMYAAAMFTSGRGFNTEATEGDANRTYAFAGDLNDAGSIKRTGSPISFATSRNFDDLTTLDVNVHLSSAGSLTFGVQKDANGSNWHFAQIMSIIYSKSPDLTGLKATRDALVSEAEGVLASADAALLTTAQKKSLQDAIDEGNSADDFDELNTVTLTTLPNAINTAKQQIQQVKDNRVLMIAALERFENDYNLADGTDYRRLTMSAEAWTALLAKVDAVNVALDDVSLASEYATRKNALVDQMDATDASLRLFKSYKAMVDGCTSLGIAGNYGADSNMDTDATQQTAITALNTAFGNYADAQAADFNAGAFLGENLDFSAAAWSIINGDNSNTIKAVTGWEVDYADADTWAVLQTDQAQNDGKLYIRKNWGSSATTMTVTKQKMLPIGKYRLSLSWNSDMANMTNLSQFKVGEATTVIGKNANEILTYDFEVTEGAQPFDLVIGFQKQNTGNTPAQIIADNITLTYIKALSLANDADNSSVIASAVATGRAYNVTLQGRKLYKDDSWNTICLPFSMTAEQVTAQLAPTSLMELDIVGEYSGHTTGLDGETLYLYFKDATAIEAGKPYIIKWTSDGEINNPTFTGVTLTSSAPADVKSTDGNVTFKGTYSPAALAKDDKTTLFLAADNTLDWPSSDDFHINAFRAYFKISEAAANGAREFKLRFGIDDITGINLQSGVKDTVGDGYYYTINGQRLNGKPATPGVYIYNGKKIVIE